MYQSAGSRAFGVASLVGRSTGGAIAGIQNTKPALYQHQRRAFARMPLHKRYPGLDKEAADSVAEQRDFKPVDLSTLMHNDDEKKDADDGVVRSRRKKIKVKVAAEEQKAIEQRQAELKKARDLEIADAKAKARGSRFTLADKIRNRAGMSAKIKVPPSAAEMRQMQVDEARLFKRRKQSLQQELQFKQQEMLREEAQRKAKNNRRAQTEEEQQHRFEVEEHRKQTEYFARMEARRGGPVSQEGLKEENTTSDGFDEFDDDDDEVDGDVVYDVDNDDKEESERKFGEMMSFENLDFELEQAQLETQASKRNLEKKKKEKALAVSDPFEAGPQPFENDMVTPNHPTFHKSEEFKSFWGKAEVRWRRQEYAPVWYEQRLDMVFKHGDLIHVQRARDQLAAGPIVNYGPSQAICYAATHAVSNFTIVERVLRDLCRQQPDAMTGFSPKTCLDFGTGPGSAPCAIAEVWPGETEDLVIIEPSAAMFDISAALLAKDNPYTRFQRVKDQSKKFAQKPKSSKASTDSEPRAQGKIASTFSFDVNRNRLFPPTLKPKRNSDSVRLPRSAKERHGEEGMLDAEDEATDDGGPKLMPKHYTSLPQFMKSNSAQPAPLQFDLVTSAYSLGVLPNDDARALAVALLWESVAPGGLLVVIESDLPSSAKFIQIARDCVIQQSQMEELVRKEAGESIRKKSGKSRGVVLAPCGHSGTCPLNFVKTMKVNPTSESSTAPWCHFVQVVPPNERVRPRNRGRSSGIFPRSKYSYVVCQKPALAEAESEAESVADQEMKQEQQLRIDPNTIPLQAEDESPPWLTESGADDKDEVGQNVKQVDTTTGLDPVIMPTNLDSDSIAADNIAKFGADNDEDETSDDEEIAVADTSARLTGEGVEYGRILGEPLHRGKHLILDLCMPNPDQGVERYAITRGKMRHVYGAYAAAKQSSWGGLWPLTFPGDLGAEFKAAEMESGVGDYVRDDWNPEASTEERDPGSLFGSDDEELMQFFKERQEEHDAADLDAKRRGFGPYKKY